MGVTPSRTTRQGGGLNIPGRVVPLEDSWTLKGEEVETMDGTELVAAMVHRLQELLKDYGSRENACRTWPWISL